MSNLKSSSSPRPGIIFISLVKFKVQVTSMMN
jgi:hypothetical protein